LMPGPISPWLELGLLAGGIGLAAVAGRHNRPSNFSIFPEIKLNARLIRSGPYRFIRHPMYTALVLIATAAAAYRGHYLNFAGLGLMALALIGKTTKEERALAAEFSEFAEYRKRTTRFVPYLF
jgi:protein-S-isoprenylcysteine O-methyltransferase Ste14